MLLLVSVLHRLQKVLTMASVFYHRVMCLLTIKILYVSFVLDINTIQYICLIHAVANSYCCVATNCLRPTITRFLHFYRKMVYGLCHGNGNGVPGDPSAFIPPDFGSPD